jgi:hypothetical protein
LGSVRARGTAKNGSDLLDRTKGRVAGSILDPALAPRATVRDPGMARYAMNEFRMIMEIAEGLRREFGAEIDAQPGSVTVEAGQANRAFRVVVACILKAIMPGEADAPGLQTWVLRRAAEDRLASDGVHGDMAVTLLDMEPPLGDSWYVESRSGAVV